jgi:hypothetical protein
VVNLDQTKPALPNENEIDLGLPRPVCLTGGFLTTAQHNSSDRVLPKTLRRLMRTLSFCPHSNVGWPIRCNGEKMALQHCCDCGAERTYMLQPSLQKGPWRRPPLYVAAPVAVSFASTMHGGLPFEPAAIL